MGNNERISKEAFKEVLFNLIELEVLDMPLPKVKELNFSKVSTMQAVRDWDKVEQKTCRGT